MDTNIIDQNQPLSNPRRLRDRFGRDVDYLRVSVTDKCDLRCSYCMPKGFRGFEEPENWLSFVEIDRVVAAFGRLGVFDVRLTGGEPLLRRNLPDLVAAFVHAILSSKTSHCRPTLRNWKNMRKRCLMRGWSN